MYAEVSDLEARWRTLTSEEVARAEVLLGDAAVRIDTLCPPPDPLSEAQRDARMIVACEMVKRAMSAPGGVGVASIQQGAGPYQATTQFANPTGDLYLTKADRLLLECGAQAAFTLPMGRVDEPETPPWWVTQ